MKRITEEEVLMEMRLREAGGDENGGRFGRKDEGEEEEEEKEKEEEEKEDKDGYHDRD